MRTAAFVFILSRSVVFLIFVLATHITVHKPAEEFGRSVTEMQIRIRRTSLQDNLRQLAYRSDGGWYLGIAERGYEEKRFDPTGPHNWAFFPLYPMLIRGAAQVTGEFPLTAIALSNLFLFLALIALHKTARAFGFDGGVADRCILYIAIFPASYFFSLPWTTSLLLLLSTASFLLARRGQWLASSCLAGLASATHYSGIFVFPALVVLYWQEALRPFRLRLTFLRLLPAPVGLLCFMAFLYSLTGNAFAFSDAQAAWGIRLGFFWNPVWGFISSPFALSEGWNFRLLNFAVTIMTLGCGLGLLKHRQWSWALYTFISAMVPLSLFTLQARYVMVIFPVFVMLAEWGRSSRIDQATRTIFTALLGLLSALYCFFFGIALI